MLSFLSWILFGIVIGAFARLLIPGRQDIGFLLTCGLGVLGSILGGFITWLFRGAPRDAYDPAGWIMSVVGAIIVLGVYISIQKRSGTKRWT